MKNNRVLKITILIILVSIAAGGITLTMGNFNLGSSRAGEPPKISGTYLFKKENCTRAGCFSGANPKFTLGYLQYLEGAQQVHVSQTISGISINHSGWEGKPMHMELLDQDSNLGWNRKEINYKLTEWGVQFGVERQSKMLHLYLDKSRSLIIETTTNKIGLALFFIPFSESMTYQVKLVRADDL